MNTSFIGKQAPDFQLETVLGDGSDFGTVSLSQYRGKWLVFFFFPMAFTSVCSSEITALNDAASEFEQLGAAILGVSTDSKFTIRAWIHTPRERNGLGSLAFPLASDKTKQVSREYGMLMEEEGVALRGLFLIDPEGQLKYQVVHHVDVGRSVDETLRVLQALQAGGLCPANWQPQAESK